MAGKWVRDSLSEMVFKPNPENIKELARTGAEGRYFGWKAKLLGGQSE